MAEAALRDLLVDPRLLQRMELPLLREPFERRDLALHARGRRDARAHGGAVDDDGARAALAQPTAEPRALQAEVVAKDVQQRRRRIDVHRVRTSVHSQVDGAHGVFL